MTRLFIGLAALAALMLTYPVGKKVVDTVRSNGLTQEKENASVLPPVMIPNLLDLLTSDAPTKASTIKTTITLETKKYCGAPWSGYR